MQASKTEIKADFQKVHKTLRDEARKGYKRSPEECMNILKCIVPLCGQFSHGSKVCREIGLWLLRGHTEIIVPVCQDYSHKEDKFNGGVPSLGKKHIDFLRILTTHIREATVTFLMADHEVDDPMLCRIVGKSHVEFKYLVSCSINDMRNETEQFGWKTMVMTDYIPNLIEQEILHENWIRNSPEFKQRIDTDTIQRGVMYERLSGCMDYQEMAGRTIHTAAQYVTLGKHAKESNKLICNHTTTNLSWYLQVGVAVLHNPVSLY